MKAVTADTLKINCPSLQLIQGPKNQVFRNVQPATSATSESLVFVNSIELLNLALSKKVSGLILLESLLKNSELPSFTSHDQTSVWTTPNIHKAQSEVLKLFSQETFLNSGRHSTAIIAHSADIDPSAIIEAYAIIGENVRIEKNCIVRSHSVIENNCIIQESTQIGPHSVIGFNCQIGKNCLIGSHTRIGSDGFGFYTDTQRQHHKIAQIGHVVIEDNFECGSFCAIDRATMTTTIIRQGTKFDNHIHIAHNCEVGENSMLTAGFMTAGSTKMGKNLITGGGVHVNGHIEICDNVILAGRTGVTSSITQPGVYGGYPHVEHKLNLKVMTSVLQLPRIRKQISQILKHLNLNES